MRRALAALILALASPAAAAPRCLELDPFGKCKLHELQAARALQPIDGTVVGPRPTLSWSEPPRVDVRIVQLCSEPTCAAPLEVVEVAGSSWTPDHDLAPGELYWRVVLIRRRTGEERFSPTQRLTVQAAASPEVPPETDLTPLDPPPPPPPEPEPPPARPRGLRFRVGPTVGYATGLTDHGERGLYAGVSMGVRLSGRGFLQVLLELPGRAVDASAHLHDAWLVGVGAAFDATSARPGSLVFRFGGRYEYGQGAVESATAGELDTHTMGLGGDISAGARLGRWLEVTLDLGVRIHALYLASDADFLDSWSSNLAGRAGVSVNLTWR